MSLPPINYYCYAPEGPKPSQNHSSSDWEWTVTKAAVAVAVIGYMGYYVGTAGDTTPSVAAEAVSTVSGGVYYYSMAQYWSAVLGGVTALATTVFHCYLGTGPFNVNVKV